MLSWDVVEHGRPLQKVLKDTPKPTGTEVLVRVTRSGICHSDLHIWDGYFDLGGGKRFYVKDRGCVPPFTMGHEPFGIVEALGPRAKGARVGQKRVVFPWIGCGKCAVCKDGQDNYCLSQKSLGVYTRGAYGTHITIPHPRYLVDASGVDEAFAATLACSGLTAYSATAKLPALQARDWVAIMGCGGLGLVGISILRAKGVRNIIACDIDPDKLAAARQLGAKLVLDTRAPDAAQDVVGAPHPVQCRIAEHRVELGFEIEVVSVRHACIEPALERGGNLRLAPVHGHDPAAQRRELLRQCAVAAAEVEDSLARTWRKHFHHGRPEIGNEARVTRVASGVPGLPRRHASGPRRRTHRTCLRAKVGRWADTTAPLGGEHEARCGR